MTTFQKWLFAGIIAVAIFFRLFQIINLPGGLFPDEAANGLDINLMQQGNLQPFYERGNGREALFFYMLWGSVELFGKGPWQHHIVSAIIGIISVLFCFLLTKKLWELFASDESKKKQAINIALLASFLMAVSAWHIVLSRTAFRANLIPLFTSLSLYGLLCIYTSKVLAKKALWAIIFGAVFALGFYTYIAYRILVPIIFIAVLWPILADFFKKPRGQNIKKFLFPLAISMISFSIFIFPIAKYFYTHPGSFVGRSGQVSIFNPELNHGNLIGTLGEVSKTSIFAYFSKGDLNWRHNISGFPFLSPLISPFFGLGLILALIFAIRYLLMPNKYSKDWKFFLLTGWFWGMLLPVVTTAEGIPHGLRSIGTIPTVFIISAYGLYTFINWITNLIDLKKFNVSEWKIKLVKTGFKLVLICYVTAFIIQSYSLYFIYAANSAENYYSFRSDLTTVSEFLNNRYLNNKGDKTNTYLILDKFSVQTTDYFTSLDAANPENPINQPYTQVDPEDSWKLSNLKSEDIIIFCQSSLFDIKKFKLYHPNSELINETRNKFGQTIMAVYKINN